MRVDPRRAVLQRGREDVPQRLQSASPRARSCPGGRLHRVRLRQHRRGDLFPRQHGDGRVWGQRQGERAAGCVAAQGRGQVRHPLPLHPLPHWVSQDVIKLSETNFKILFRFSLGSGIL